MAHPEHIVGAVVFVVGAMWWLLSERRGVYGVAVLVSYVATFTAVRAWRLRSRVT